MDDHSKQSNKILIVEDSVFERLAIKCLFEQYQFECDQASTGAEALNMVQKRMASGKPMYRLIMMDYKMPMSTGAEAAQKIRSLLEESRDEGALPPEQQSVIKPYIVCMSIYGDN